MEGNVDSTVIRDISDDGAPAASAPGASTRPEPARERSARRFAFDPASSPVLVAALAWDTAVRR